MQCARCVCVKYSLIHLQYYNAYATLAKISFAVVNNMPAYYTQSRFRSCFISFHSFQFFFFFFSCVSFLISVPHILHFIFTVMPLHAQRHVHFVNVCTECIFCQHLRIFFLFCFFRLHSPFQCLFQVHIVFVHCCYFSYPLSHTYKCIRRLHSEYILLFFYCSSLYFVVFSFLFSHSTMDGNIITSTETYQTEKREIVQNR